MPAPEPSRLRIRSDGKFFRLGAEKFYVKGLCYGPFGMTPQQDWFPAPEQARRDLALVHELGANLLRVYHLPPRWFLDLCLEEELRLFVDVPWNEYRCFLDSPRLRAQIRTAVRDAVNASCGHPAVFAYCVANEIPAEIVRWSGNRAISEFLDELILEAKSVDPECLCTFANYPPTEFVQPQNTDFLCFNVYLHQQRSYENYLARLQLQADSKPLLIGEFGIDSQREGEARKSEILSWQIESTFRAGLAGTILFSFTDEWFKDGRQVEGWTFGLTTIDRKRKDSFAAVQSRLQQAPWFPLAQYPKVSVVVASYNSASTLRACLESLSHLDYPDYEVILVDDGSTDSTPQIASLYPNVVYIRQNHRGLSVARNTGIQAANGEVVAFTDADCRADAHWLYYLIGDLLKFQFVGVGGPNLLPPEDSPTAAAVMASPGGPAHVMIDDRQAEHIPGCNMAFYKWALQEVGSFDPVFHKAGDDVDLCWRLQQHGYLIGFSPSAFVWHFRRSTPLAYLRQQKGYGEAEALLAHKHPEYFSPLGGSAWRGRIYTPSLSGLVVRHSIIYHGTFGAGFFQSLYGAEPAWALMFCTSLEYHTLVSLPLLLLSIPFRFLWPIAACSLLLSLTVCLVAALQAKLPATKKRFWSRPLIAALFFLQPIVRGSARYRGHIGRGLTPAAARTRLRTLPPAQLAEPLHHLYYWTGEPMERLELISRILARLEKEGWTLKTDTGWCNYDLEILGNRWSRVQVTTVTEYLANYQKLFRCRLRASWSLPASLLFWSTAILEIVLIGLFVERQPWLWFILLSLPLLAWFLSQEKLNLQRVIAAFMDESMAEFKFVKVYFNPEEDTFVPAIKKPFPDRPPEDQPDTPKPPVKPKES